MPTRRMTILASAAVLATVLVGAMPAHAQALQTLCGGQLRVRLPEGWKYREVGPGAVVLQGGNIKERIELMLWDAPATGDVSAAAAANAQETLLYRRVPYTRKRLEVFRTDTGLEGQAVLGQVRQDEGELQDSVFVAFAFKPAAGGGTGKYCVLGMFGAAGTAGKLLMGPLGTVARAFEWVAPIEEETPQVTPLPPQPQPEPGLAPLMVERPAGLPTLPPAAAPPLPADAPAAVAPAAAGAVAVPTPPAAAAGSVAGLAPEPRGPEKVAPPAVQDAVTAPAPGPQARLVQFTSPLGFTLRHPVGWQVVVHEGHIEVSAAPGDGSGAPAATVVFWPLVGVNGAGAIDLGRAVLQRTELTALGAAGLKARQHDEVAVLAGTVGAGKAMRRLVACCHVRGENALLTALLVRPDEFAERLPSLLGVLASFEAGPWWTTAAQQSAKTVLWEDPVQGVLQAPMPAGWKVKGGVQPFNGVWTLFVEGNSGDERQLAVLWQQPLAPLFRELTPVLRNLGWQEGDKYLANPGDQQLRILSRLTPQDFITKYWLTTPTQRLEGAVVERMDSRPQVSALLTGEHAAGVVARLRGDMNGQPRQRLCLVATADAPARIGANCWQAGVLQCEAPSGALEEALEVLRVMVEGAQVTPGATHPAAATGVETLLAGARTALGALPPRPQPTAGASALAGLNERGHGDLWLLSGAALEPWERAARRLEQGPSFPGGRLLELDADFWK